MAMCMSPPAALLLLCVVALLAAPAAAQQQRVLALLQDAGGQDQYSQFFGSLKDHGFQVDFRRASDSSLKLQEYDTWLYDHLVIFAPNAASFGGTITSSAIVDFVDSGRNVILAGAKGMSENIRGLALDLGVEFDERTSSVYDHFGYKADSGDHTLIGSSAAVGSKAILPEPLKGPVLFRGVGQAVPADSELVTVALSASDTAYSYDPKKALPDPPALPVGASIALVTLLQARNNARVLVSGSVDLFSDKLFSGGPLELAGAPKKTYAESGNTQFATATALWTFKRRGVLQASNVRHHVEGIAEQPELYRVNDQAEFAVDIFELRDGAKVPYQGKDVQIEFIMLYPYVRQTLTSDGKGTFSTKFKVPDVYGVFKYDIHYKHLGYSYIDLSLQVPVRPFKHNEYERFLLPAYPYYAAALSTMTAFFALGFFFLYTK